MSPSPHQQPSTSKTSSPTFPQHLPVRTMLATATSTLVFTIGLAVERHPLHPIIRSIPTPPITPACVPAPSATRLAFYRPTAIDLPQRTMPSNAPSRFHAYTNPDAPCPLFMPPDIIDCNDRYSVLWEGSGTDRIHTVFNPSPDGLNLQDEWHVPNGVQPGVAWDYPWTTNGVLLCEASSYVIVLRKEAYENMQTPEGVMGNARHVVVQKILGKGKVRQWTVEHGEGVYQQRRLEHSG